MFEELGINDENIYAHISKEENKDKERLSEHTSRCLKYYKKLKNTKNVDAILENIYSNVGIELKEDFKSLVKEMLDAIIKYHDVGKINPIFQREKMKNKDCKEKAIEGVSKGNHSLLSSVIYMDYFMGKLMKIKPKNEQIKIIIPIMIINSYIISRHHSSLNNVKEYIDMLAEGGDVYIIVKGFNEIKNLKIKCLRKMIDVWNGYGKKFDFKEDINVFIYARLMYSILVTSDYYATTEYMNGVEIKDFGNIDDIEGFKKVYEDTELIKKIRSYKKDANTQISEMNKLRTEMFLEVEENWKNNNDKNIYFLEAPTGSGKSNVGMNISFNMLKEKEIEKIFYVYPFNTLIEQNLDSLSKIFEENEEKMSNISVLNSLTPIKKESEDEDINTYIKALLNRQFLNYPFVLTTHVSIFETMFGANRESVFGFLQLANSIIVLDEIQTYRNSIWAEIISFLNEFAEVLNIKVIIMSATFPGLDKLLKDDSNVFRLMKNRDKYYKNPIFKDRVEISTELLNEEIEYFDLYEHLNKQDLNGKKIVFEFVEKDTAYEFNDFILEQEEDNENLEVLLLTGDDNIAERKKVIDKIKTKNDKTIILIATQVIEAGVDIDMDIGYKNISILDAEEQFMGRINRSCSRKGIVYFFKKDEASTIYKNDIRREKNLTLKKEDMLNILKEKEFHKYYQKVIDILKKNKNELLTEEGLTEFFDKKVKKLNFKAISKRMKLIDEETWKYSLFINSIIKNKYGECIKGSECWEKYKELLKNDEMEYAKKRVELSKIRSDMNYFIYQISVKREKPYADIEDSIGELDYIENGEKFLKNGKLNFDAFEKSNMFF